MENIIEIIEIFAFFTGIAYIVLEILQKNLMWVVGIATGLACAFSFGVQSLYASCGLNIYYVFVSLWGLYQWKHDSEGLSSGEIHLCRPSLKVLLLSLAFFVVGSLALVFLLRFLGDSESALDAVVTVASAIATVWLAKSYPQQWLVWIAADMLSVVLCLCSGMYWMSVLYAFYTASAVYGYIHWTSKGKYV